MSISFRCNCVESYTVGCNATTGTCLCKAGLQGAFCNEPCEKGTWGVSCLNTCSCGEGMTCDTVNGQCHKDCPAGWTAEKCDQRKLTGLVIALISM